MAELIKALSRFLYRDLIYVIGGTAIILSFLHLFDRIPSSTLPAIYYLFGAGAAYVVGYVAQELGCLVGLATVADYFEPCRPLQCLHRWFTREPWSPIARFDTIEATLRVSRDQMAAELLERVVFHRQLGTTMGPCALLSAVCLLIRGANSAQPQSRFDLTLGGAAIALGVVLLVLGWLKGAQQIRWLHVLKEQGLTTGSSGPADAGRSA